jgi:hypothetical protein
MQLNEKNLSLPLSYHSCQRSCYQHNKQKCVVSVSDFLNRRYDMKGKTTEPQMLQKHLHIKQTFTIISHYSFDGSFRMV